MVDGESLTKAERDIAVLIGRGLSNAAIGECLVIEVGTVKNHVHSILQKLGLRSRTEVALWVAARNWASGERPSQDISKDT
jgi:DNA-binding NarL/FixJ family response regulator